MSISHYDAMKIILIALACIPLLAGFLLFVWGLADASRRGEEMAKRMHHEHDRRMDFSREMDARNEFERQYREALAGRQHKSKSQ